ncbi:MAG: glutamate-1-semialdehyde 2,1-aminomutase [Longimicrobiales bacterium]
MTRAHADSTARTATSAQLFARAQDVIAGGVNSPVRAFRGVGGDPRFIVRGEGAHIVDADGNRYIDYVLSWGPLVLGHAHPAVVNAVTAAARDGTSFGAPCTAEIELAERIRAAMPAVQRIRMVNSGTEAVMSAIRLARAYTARSKFIKFAGCYHGHADLLLVQAGSGVATLSLPDSPGVPAATVADTLVANYNDLTSVETLFDQHGNDIAAVIVEPVAGNMGLVLPQDGFLTGLRALTRDHGALLLFDEVMTGFRVGPGGAQTRFGVTPDLTALGKVIGGGLPVGAFGGRREIMDLLAPTGPVYQAGTLSGNPIAMKAGIATLDLLGLPGVQDRLEAMATATSRALAHEAARAGVPLRTSSIGSMFGFFFTENPVRDWAGASATDRNRYAAFFHTMLDSGVYMAPSAFEAAFVSTVHGDAELDTFRDAVRHAFSGLG